MDKTIRRNEICIVGLPRCDYVFLSTRSCFIAYGFEQSTLEMTILKKLLEERGIEPIEAGGMRAPAQNAFCAKICSKIIVSQFCIVLINNEIKGNMEVPNANVNMEYGLMLGFNKHVIPFQKAEQSLPFNVAGLDTIKYTNSNFETLAKESIDQAISITRQEDIAPIEIDQVIGTYLLMRKFILLPLDNEGDKMIYNLGMTVGFNLLCDFSGIQYTFFGNFTFLRPEIVLWKIRTIHEILEGRRSTLGFKQNIGMITEEQKDFIDLFFRDFNIFVIVNSDDDKKKVNDVLANSNIAREFEILSMNDVRREIEKFVGAVA
jgi:hypothetical protein